MTRPVSRSAIVWAIVRKDAREFRRDRLWLVLTTVGLVVFIALFWLLPSSVVETIRVGVYPADLADSLNGLGASGAEGGQGLEVVSFASPEALRAAVAGEGGADGGASGGDVAAGLAFPADFTARAARDETSDVTVYVGGNVPAEVRGAMESAVREIAAVTAAAAAGEDPASAVPVRQRTAVLGPDLAGRQVTPQERMRPLLAYFVLVMESLVLASLIAVEIQRRTVIALMATPARVSDILTAKVLLGTALAFSQAVILLALTRSFGAGWSLLLAGTLLGAVIATGTALLSGSAGKDFIGTLFLGMALLIPLAIPAVTALLPGATATWIKVLPTWGVIEVMVGVTSYGKSWPELWAPLGLAAVWCAVILVSGLAVLRRKVGTL
ncbi:MAG TPA: ABC transporter permease [Thermoleophilia bacterium]|nr:ABC transporter permease [Thermoleophilia bacterium]